MGCIKLVTKAILNILKRVTPWFLIYKDFLFRRKEKLLTIGVAEYSRSDRHVFPFGIYVMFRMFLYFNIA